MININETYTAIEGEGIWQGLLCYFIRFSGCNMKCLFCDTDHKDCVKKHQQEIKEDILKYYKQESIKRIVITGGEPFLQIEELTKLLQYLLQVSNLEVSIYTNGSLEIPFAFINNPKIHIILDYKIKESHKMLEKNLIYLSKKDIIKFVIDNVNQLNNVKRIIENYQATFIITPSYGLINPMDIANKMIELKIDNIKLGIQQHKYIYPPNMRGV